MDCNIWFGTVEEDISYYTKVPLGVGPHVRLTGSHTMLSDLRSIGRVHFIEHPPQELLVDQSHDSDSDALVRSSDKTKTRRLGREGHADFWREPFSLDEELFSHTNTLRATSLSHSSAQRRRRCGMKYEKPAEHTTLLELTRHDPHRVFQSSSR